MPNKYFSLKNKKLFLKTENKKKKQLPNISWASFSFPNSFHRLFEALSSSLVQLFFLSKPNSSSTNQISNTNQTSSITITDLELYHRFSQGRAARVVVVVYTASRGGEVHRASRGELNLSLSLKPAHSPSLSKLRIWIKPTLFCFDFWWWQAGSWVCLINGLWVVAMAWLC